MHPDSASVEAIEDVIYSAPVLEKPVLLLRLIDINCHNIACLRHALQQPDNALMLLAADCYLAMTDETRRRKFRGDIITTGEMWKQTLARVSELEGEVQRLRDKLMVDAEVAREYQAQDRGSQVRDRNQLREVRGGDQPRRTGGEQARTVNQRQREA